VNDATLCGTYLHFRIGAELSREAGLPIPLFEPKAPLPTSSYCKKGEWYNRRDLFDVSLSYWEDFKRVMNPLALGVERAVHHPSGYAGRVDLVLSLRTDGKKLVGREFKCDRINEKDIWLVDIKSSRLMSDEYYAQVWAYAQAWNYLFPRRKVNRIAILRLNGETGWEFVETNGNKLLWESAMGSAKQKGVLFQ